MPATSKKISIGYDKVKPIMIGKGLPLVFIGGPCAIESYDHSMYMAENIQKICVELNIDWVFKSCYDKDCRSSPDSYHGIGLQEGMKILSEIRNNFGVPVVSDFSDVNDGNSVGEVCDLVQIPAYLCRQTSILKTAAKTGRPVHLKKGQFMSPWNMKNSVKKLEINGCEQILLTERGTFYGYNMLVNDLTSLPIMSKTGYPVCYDATHSIQLPTSMGSISGGQREFIPGLVRSAVAIGINALFMEVHDNPVKALSDSNTVLDLKYLKQILNQAIQMHNTYLDIITKYGEDNVHKK
ncbi:3-deoxy-8-phosphooctulonate synthase [Pseudomonadota bacterium]|nr:3-deoxy-8-phosphooctulonate synthase [Pseudomonadota bacterium]